MLTSSSSLGTLPTYAANAPDILQPQPSAAGIVVVAAAAAGAAVDFVAVVVACSCDS